MASEQAALAREREPSRAFFSGGLEVEEIPSGLRASCPEGNLVVEALEPGVCRLRCTSLAAMPARSKRVVRDLPAAPARVMREEGGIAVTTSDWQLRLEGDPLRIRFSAPDGTTWLSSAADGAFEREADGSITTRFALAPGERLFGLGEKTGGLEKRGRRWTMANREPMGVRLGQDALYQSHPFCLGLLRGTAWGLYLDCVPHSVFDLGHRERDVALLQAPQRVVDLYLVAGPGAKQVIERYTALVGRHELPPRWAMGYHQSRWGYMTSKEVLQVAARMRAERVPCDAIHLDIDYMDGWRVFTWHPKRFPDGPGLIRELAEQGFKTVTIVDPGVKVERSFSVYRQGRELDYFLKRASGAEYHGNVWPGITAFPDFSRADVRGWWAELLGKLIGAGAAGIWNDMNEPAWYIPRPKLTMLLYPWMRPGDVVFEDEGRRTRFAELHNYFANFEAMATVDAFERHAPGRRPFVLSRAGFAGVQRWAAVWTGDNMSRFGHLAQSIPMLLSLGVSGVAFCGADIGGFTGSCTPELFARWIQLGSLTPFCRTHSIKLFSRRQEPWSFGPRVLEIARRWLELRYRLLPLLVTLFHETALRGLPVMRPLFLEFPHDEQACAEGYTFLLGADLLAAPVLEAKAVEREVYLPEGRWYEWHSGALYTGPAHLTVPAPLELMPLFLRGGGIVPMWPARERADLPLPEELTLRCFPDPRREGVLELYDDEGEGLGYRDGQSRVTRYRCIQTAGTVTVERGDSWGELAYAPSRVVVQLVLESPPSRVTLDGGELEADAVSYDRDRSLLECRLRVRDASWKLDVATGAS